MSLVKIFRQMSKPSREFIISWLYWPELPSLDEEPLQVWIRTMIEEARFYMIPDELITIAFLRVGIRFGDSEKPEWLELARRLNDRPRVRLIGSEAFERVAARFGYFKNKWELEHSGYPLPDETGRPKLSWNYCAYYNCRCTCSKLVDHLEHHKVFVPGFHQMHEIGVQQNDLTPDRVLRDSMTRCPSMVCDVVKFATPELLIDHLTRLGIPPFWKPSTRVEPVIPPTFKELTMAALCTKCERSPPNLIDLSTGSISLCHDCYPDSAIHYYLFV